MGKFKSFKSIKEIRHNGRKYTILVYGEVNEVNEMTGFYTVPVVFNSKTNKPVAIDYDKRFITPGYKQYYGRTKVFNMGWSICADCDEFDLETGIKICRRRFNRSPITTQNGRFLTPDMCLAIVNNEANYISNNIELFLPKKWTTEIKFNIPVENINTTEEDKGIVLDFKVKDSNINDFLKRDDIESMGVSDFINFVLDLSKPKENKENLDDNDITIELETDDSTSVIEFNDGDYVYFEIDNTPYVGIYNSEVIDESSNEWLRDKYYFYAPIDSNGLIKHNDARFFASIGTDTPYDILAYAEDSHIKLINEYLKGAHSKAWDNEKKRFKIVF